MTERQLLDQLAGQRVLPVLRTPSADEAVRAAGEVVAAGLTVVELTATTPDWPSALREVVASSPSETLVGLGTVTDADTALRAVDCGAAFVVSPWSVPDVRRVTDTVGIPFLEGAFSPGEIAAAATQGPVKLFPAHVGGVQLLVSIRALLPDAVIVPTGGIALDDVPSWLSAGAHAVGVGSALLQPGVLARLPELLGTPAGR